MCLLSFASNSGASLALVIVSTLPRLSLSANQLVAFVVSVVVVVVVVVVLFLLSVWVLWFVLVGLGSTRVGANDPHRW